MADEKVKITAFDAATVLADTDLVPFVQDVGTTPVTKKTAWSLIKSTLRDAITTAADNANTETLADNLVLDDDDLPIQFLDAGGSARNITLPAEATTNHEFFIVNTGGETLTVLNDAAGGIDTVETGETKLFISDGTTWAALSDGPMTTADKTKLDYLTLASATSITGGGTIALGGYTLTIPATGTPALLGTANTFTASNNNFQGTTANDLPTYSTEFLDADNWTAGAGWTGSFAAGFAHSSGTATLTHDHAAVNATKYQIAYTVTGRTAGTFTIAFGGQSVASISATGAWGPTSTNTDVLVITPTTDFNGTIVISIKSITAVSTALINLRNSAGTVVNEIRSGNSNTNVAIGVAALNSNTTGTNNSAMGNSALRSNTTGTNNNATGFFALYSNTTGIENSAMGVSALYSNTTGAYNNAFGRNAGRTITTGTYNTFIGHEAGYNASQKVDATNSMALGNGAYTTADNQIVIGNTSVTSTIIRGAISILANNIVTDTTTGMKIGTAADQKLSFWNAAPVVQQVLATGAGKTVDEVITMLQTLGLCKQS